VLVLLIWVGWFISKTSHFWLFLGCSQNKQHEWKNLFSVLEEGSIEAGIFVGSRLCPEGSDEVSDSTWRDLFFGFKAISEEECIHEHTI
jgi:hypothetical protein